MIVCIIVWGYYFYLYCSYYMVYGDNLVFYYLFEVLIFVIVINIFMGVNWIF